MNIGKLERVALREVWKHEAYDFTQWLEQNIEVLNEAIDINLVNIEREQSAGTFSVDLVAEDVNGGTVVIENQLEKSDHDHLGKLITYLTAMDAKTAIWIVSNPRPEHVAAIPYGTPRYFSNTFQKPFFYKGFVAAFIHYLPTPFNKIQRFWGYSKGYKI